MKILETAKKAKVASYSFKNTSVDIRNKVLKDLKTIIIDNTQNIIKHNKLDIDDSIKNGLSESLIDRLTLNEDRIKGMADGIEVIINLEDPINLILEHRVLDNGLDLKKVSVPFGTIGIIYESRPNVTIDCAALCIKSSNTCVLKGGKEAFNTNKYLVSLVHQALKQNDLSEDVVVLCDNPSREEVAHLMKAKEYIDLLIPRGSANLINHTLENARVPVIETGAGICHIYVDNKFNEEKAINIIVNAKVSRPSVCNAVETLLVNREIAKDFLPKISKALKENNVVLNGNKEVKDIIDVNLLKDDEYDIEYLNLTLAIKVVEDVDEAIKHINKFGTKHSDAIITDNIENATKFFNTVDSSSIYHNTSTRFTDGGVFGLGAEIGISTQKMHARGPMGLKELTTYAYHIKGDGQIR